MQVKYKVFPLQLSMENALQEAAAFATNLGRERLINIAASSIAIIVWYWDSEAE